MPLGVTAHSQAVVKHFEKTNDKTNNTTNSDFYKH